VAEELSAVGAEIAFPGSGALFGGGNTLILTVVRKGSDVPSLLDPVQLGDLKLPNRVIMAPLTAARDDR